MSEGSSYADLIILALIAVFILLRLRSVLGDRTGNDEPGYFSRPMTPVDRPEAIVQLEDRSARPRPREERDSYIATVTDSALVETLNAIKAKDPHFTAGYFLSGARGAFEMVFDAFNRGDRQTLKMLMSDALYQEFGQAIADAEAGDRRTETTLVSVTAKDITQATLTQNMARLTVLFASEQVSVTRNSNGDIVGGDPSDIRHAEDHWVFERDITSKNPNWKIIET